MTIVNAQTTPEGCFMIEAVTPVHPMLGEMASIINSTEEKLIGTFMVGRDSATWFAKCETCIGDVTVRHFFNDPELGPHVQVTLANNCPSKPDSEDTPILFVETLPESK